MVMVGSRRQDNTPAPSVSGHLYYDDKQKGNEKGNTRGTEKAETELID